MVDQANVTAADIPRFLYLHCDQCLRYGKIEELTSEIAQEDPFKGRKIIIGICRRCGEECRESIHTRAELLAVAKRSVKYFEQAEKKRKKRKEKKLVMVKKSKKRDKNKKVKSPDESEKKKKKGSKKSKSSKSSKSSSGRTHESHWKKLDGVNGVTSLMMCIAGGPYTLEEAQERHDRLAKKKLISERVPPLTTTDFTWAQLNEVEIDGKKHGRLVGFNDDEEFVFSVPSLPDPLKKNAKAIKARKKGGKFIVNGVTMAQTRKALKG